VNKPPRENEIRRLLSKAWSRRRRQAGSPIVHNASHLDLNRELQEARGESMKYFFAALILAGFLYLVWSRIGLT
jgi:hypothetical protein